MHSQEDYQREGWLLFLQARVPFRWTSFDSNESLPDWLIFEFFSKAAYCEARKLQLQTQSMLASLESGDNTTIDLQV